MSKFLGPMHRMIESDQETLKKVDEVTYALKIRKKTSIEIMIEEHQWIERMLKIIRKACAGILSGERIDFEDFEQMIDFVRQYADSHHHGKEEKFLFDYMEKHLGELGKKLIRNGMYVEHDLGRLYIKELEEALLRVKEGEEESKLDVIANAISYTHLLQRHIAKENEVVYRFGERQLSREMMEEIIEKTERFEQAAALEGTQERYMNRVIALEAKYK